MNKVIFPMGTGEWKVDSTAKTILLGCFVIRP